MTNLRRGRQWLVTALGCAGLAACDTEAATRPYHGNWTAAGLWAGGLVMTSDRDDPRWPADAVTINAADVEGDTLQLSVAYGGGCREHRFTLLAETGWMESYPVQVRSRLAHDAEGDACKALLSRVLRIDLSPLKAAYQASYQSATGVIIIRLDNTPVAITYTF